MSDSPSQPTTTDATYCARCGTPFGSIRVIVDGKAYHQLCAVVVEHPSQKATIASLQSQLKAAEDRIEELEKLARMALSLEYYVGNPSAWEDGYDEGMSERIRPVVESARAALPPIPGEVGR